MFIPIRSRNRHQEENQYSIPPIKSIKILPYLSVARSSQSRSNNTTISSIATRNVCSMCSIRLEVATQTWVERTSFNGAVLIATSVEVVEAAVVVFAVTVCLGILVRFDYFWVMERWLSYFENFWDWFCTWDDFVWFSCEGGCEGGSGQDGGEEDGGELHGGDFWGEGCLGDDVGGFCWWYWCVDMSLRGLDISTLSIRLSLRGQLVNLDDRDAERKKALRVSSHQAAQTDILTQKYWLKPDRFSVCGGSTFNFFHPSRRLGPSLFFGARNGSGWSTTWAILRIVNLCLGAATFPIGWMDTRRKHW